MRQLLPQKSGEKRWEMNWLSAENDLWNIPSCVALYAFRVWPCNRDLVRLVIPVNTTNLPERSNTWSRCSEQLRWEERKATTEDGVKPNGETGGPVKVRKTSSIRSFLPEANAPLMPRELSQAPVWERCYENPCNILRYFTGCPVVSGYI